MLENKYIKLRALEPEDIDVLFKWENDAQLWHLSNTVKPFSRYVLEQYIINSQLDIYEQKQLRLMIVENNNREQNAIGCIDLFDFDPVNSRAGIGLYVADNYRNKGYATHALNVLTPYCKKVLNLHQLYCTIITDNTASISVFEKAGFLKSGIHLKWIKKNNKWLDVAFYQLILSK